MAFFREPTPCFSASYIRITLKSVKLLIGNSRSNRQLLIGKGVDVLKPVQNTARPTWCFLWRLSHTGQGFFASKHRIIPPLPPRWIIFSPQNRCKTEDKNGRHRGGRSICGISWWIYWGCGLANTAVPRKRRRCDGKRRQRRAHGGANRRPAW